MPKITRLCILALISMLHASVVWSAEDPVIDTTITPFFAALKNGDVRIIETYIDDPLYSRIKILLTENQKYPEYLREYYTGAQLNVMHVQDLTEKKKEVNVDIHFPNNQVESLVLHLNQSTSGKWKVTEQTMSTH